MTMEKGLAIIEVTDTETKGFYIDQDALEFARLNAQTKKHREEAEKERLAAGAVNRKEEIAQARRNAYTLKTVACILAYYAVCGAVAWAGMAGLISPIIYAPVGLFCLCAACVRFGAWIGRNNT